MPSTLTGTSKAYRATIEHTPIYEALKPSTAGTTGTAAKCLPGRGDQFVGLVTGWIMTDPAHIDLDGVPVVMTQKATKFG
ncbi:hypothetical protein [Nocardia sp. NPDC046763]|uniref:hypothetical protein n=1 Tax=Nocardia sp. NPDC046763 TaxID=3155256 RepID=UPI0033F877B1